MDNWFTGWHKDRDWAKTTVDPSVTTIYYVSIKDENNCTPLSQSAKQVTVTDIRCGTNKVWVCEMQKNGTIKSVCIATTKLPDLPAAYSGSMHRLH